MRPLIGVSSYYVGHQELREHRLRGVFGQDMLMSNLDYARSIDEAGGIAVALPVLAAPGPAAELIGRLDGLLLAGGEDLAPELFGEKAAPGLGLVSQQRDRYEWALLTAALARGIPILGICRGLQLLNVYFGGTLHQDLATSHGQAIPHASAHLGREALVHEVELHPASLVHQAYEVASLPVNSLHHQGVARLAEPLRATARSADGLVEGVEHRTAKEVYAVQWHPEMMRERYPLHRRLFQLFVGQARNG